MSSAANVLAIWFARWIFRASAVSGVAFDRAFRRWRRYRGAPGRERRCGYRRWRNVATADTPRAAATWIRTSSQSMPGVTATSSASATAVPASAATIPTASVPDVWAIPLGGVRCWPSRAVAAALDDALDAHGKISARYPGRPGGDTLPRMASPELSRRVERAEQDLTAISDTVLDIKDTVDQHTGELAFVKRTQEQHTQLLNQHTELLNEILRRLDVR